MMRRVLVALGLVLGLAKLAQAGTWPRDDSGVAAPACATATAWGSTTGTPQTCSGTNPLPVVMVAPTVQQVGLSWFGWTGGPGSGAHGTSAVWIGPATLAGIGTVAGNQGGSFVSTNGGQTFTAVATFNPNTNADALSGVLFSNTLTQTSGGFAVASACSNGGAGCSPFYTVSRDLASATVATQTGLAATGANRGLVAWEIEQQGTTLASVVTNNGGGNIAGSPFWCTAATTQSPPGSAWTCTAQATTFGALQPTGGQQIASPGTTTAGANIWLVLAMSGTDKEVFRSTDNGTTWTSVYTFTSAPNNSVGAVFCLSSTICIATSGTRIARSTDAGATWSQVATGGTNLVGFVNFGGGLVEAIADTNNASTTFFLASDYGLTWIPGPAFKFSTGTPPISQLLQVAVNGSNVVASLGNSGNGSVDNLYSFLPPSTAQLIGSNGGAVMGAAGSPGTQAVTVQGIASGTVVPVSIGTTGTVAANQGAPAIAPNQWLVLVDQCQANASCFNSFGTAVNGTVTATLTQAANVRQHVFRVDAYCSAGTAQVTITDTSTLWQSPAGAVGTSIFTQQWSTGLALVGASPTVTLSTCGATNTGTLMVQAGRF